MQVAHRRCLQPVVDRGHVQDLGGQGGAAAVPGNEGEGCGQASASAFPEDTDPCIIEAVLGARAARRPLQGRVAVVKGRGVRVSGASRYSTVGTAPPVRSAIMRAGESMSSIEAIIHPPVCR